MAAIHSSNTKPELLVRHYLWRHGFRYRLNSPRLPGHPDLVLRRYHTCIFVNGCFWHGHEHCPYFRMPKTHIAFWQAKIERNRERDRQTQLQLASMGWHCVTVWECELKPSRREDTLRRLAFTLNEIFLSDRRELLHPVGNATYAAPPATFSMGIAAEPEPDGASSGPKAGNDNA